MTIKVTYNVTDVYMSQSVSPVYITVSYSDGGASGGGVWGTITGTLSNQTDLQTALDAKLDESTIDGGTEGQILSKASATDFDFAWINNYAKYLATNVRNQTGSTIGAFQVVYISGATGNKPLISLADADTEATSSKTYGVTATSIANNGTGDVVTAGELSGIDTSAFNEGDLLWLSTTAGGVVTSPPAEPAHAVFIGYVVRSHPTLGVIDVSIQNGYELNELHGVQITTPTDNQGLFYNATSTLWENKSITTALGYTPVPTTRNITINGVTYDLSADRTYTISTGISGSGTTNYLPKFTDATTLGNSLMREGSFGISISAAFNINWAGTAAVLQVGNYAAFGRDGNGYSFMSTNAYNYTGSSFRYMFGSLPAAIYNQEFGRHIWKIAPNGTANSDITWTTAMSLLATGNLLLNGISDSGQRLQVYGDTLLRGSGNTSATTALTVQNSTPSQIFSITNDGATRFGGPNIGIYASADRGQTINTGAGGLYIGYYATGDLAYAVPSVTIGRPLNRLLSGTAGIQTMGSVVGNYSPTSGTGQFITFEVIPTINQTGGANGITRGLYVNPTLTSAFDFRAIETTAGNVLFGSNFFWDNANGRLGIGTNAPSTTLDIRGKTRIQASGNAELDIIDGANQLRLAMGSSQGFVGTLTSHPFGFFTAASKRGEFSTNGNLILQNGGTFTDGGQRLQVIGDTLLRGSGATSATTALTVQNSDGTNIFRVRNDGEIFAIAGVRTGAINTIAGIFPSGSAGQESIILRSSASPSTSGIVDFSITNGQGNSDYTSGDRWLVDFQRGYTPTSGTGTYGLFRIRATINQTGGANGITRGLYVNPTLTAAADWRSIEWSNNTGWGLYGAGTANNYLGGNVAIGSTSNTSDWLNIAASTTAKAHINLAAGSTPTAPANGDIWFDGTDIKMRIGGVTKTFTLI